MKNKVLTFLLSLTISFGLWLYVVTVISPESEATYYNVPVELVGTDYLDANDLMIVSDTNLKMDLTLRGNRTDLKQLNSYNITIRADLSAIKTAGEHELKCSVSYPGNLQSGTVEEILREPQQIVVTVAEQMKKTILVKPSYVGSTVNGYEADLKNVSMDHSTVTIRGPKDVVEKVSYAGITVDLTGKMSTFVWDYPLILYGFDSRPIASDSYITSNLTEIRTIVQVQKVKKIPVTVLPDLTDSGLHEDLVTIYPMVREITVAGADSALNGLNEIVLGPIAMKDITRNTTLNFHLNLPEGVVCKEGIEEVSVDVRIPELGGMTLPAEWFELTNIPEGLHVKVTGTPQVDLWGPKEILESLTSEHIKGVVDCSRINETTLYAPVTYVLEDYDYLRVRVEWGYVFIEVQPIDKPAQEPRGSKQSKA